MQIFISHISEEKPLAMVIKRWIKYSFLGKIKVFVSSDSDDIPAGKKWLDEIDGALNSSKVLIVLYSHQSKFRPWINFESGCGWIKKIPIMPICHSGLTVSEIKPPISSFQGLDIELEDFTKIFFESVAKHTGFPQAPQVEVKEFMSEVKAAIDSIEQPKVIENAPIEKKNKFSEAQIKIMKGLAIIKKYERNSVDEIEFVKLLRMDAVMLQYHIESLVDEKYVYEMFRVGQPHLYSIAQKGINYLVNNGHYE